MLNIVKIWIKTWHNIGQQQEEPLKLMSQDYIASVMKKLSKYNSYNDMQKSIDRNHISPSNKKPTWTCLNQDS